GVRSPSQTISDSPVMAIQISYSWWLCRPDCSPGPTTHQEPSNVAFSAGHGTSRWACRPLSSLSASRCRLRISIMVSSRFHSVGDGDRDGCHQLRFALVGEQVV